MTKQGLDVFKCEGTLKGSEVRSSPKTLAIRKHGKASSIDAQLKAKPDSPDVAMRTLDIFAGMV